MLNSYINFLLHIKIFKLGTRKKYHNCPDNGTVQNYNTVISPINIDEMANYVVPDQTAPKGAVGSGSALFALTLICSSFSKLYRRPCISHFPWRIFQVLCHVLYCTLK